RHQPVSAGGYTCFSTHRFHPSGRSRRSPPPTKELEHSATSIFPHLSGNLLHGVKKGPRSVIFSRQSSVIGRKSDASDPDSEPAAVPAMGQFDAHDGRGWNYELRGCVYKDGEAICRGPLLSRSLHS